MTEDSNILEIGYLANASDSMISKFPKEAKLIRKLRMLIMVQTKNKDK